MPFTQVLGSAGPAPMTELEAPYKDLHQHPALSVQEVRTAQVGADAMPPPRGLPYRRRCLIERMSVHEVALAGLSDHRLFKRSSIWRARSPLLSAAPSLPNARMQAVARPGSTLKTGSLPPCSRSRATAKSIAIDACQSSVSGLFWHQTST